jgi:hypothetical protein
MLAQWPGSDSLQAGNSRVLHDTTTSSGEPYNIMINARSSVRHNLPAGLSLYKRSAGSQFT